MPSSATIARRRKLPWSDDREAQELVAAHPAGMSHAEIAVHLGVTRQRVQQLEARALRKLAALGFDFDDEGSP